MLARLDDLVRTHEELTRALGDPEVIGDYARYAETAKRHADLTEVVDIYADCRAGVDDAGHARELAKETSGEDRDSCRAEAERPATPRPRR